MPRDLFYHNPSCFTPLNVTVYIISKWLFQNTKFWDLISLHVMDYKHHPSSGSWTMVCLFCFVSTYTYQKYRLVSHILLICQITYCWILNANHVILPLPTNCNACIFSHPITWEPFTDCPGIGLPVNRPTNLKALPWLGTSVVNAIFVRGL